MPKGHIIKCHHPQVKYCGQENGQIFRDRLSVLIPLNNSTIMDGIANAAAQLEFVCQSSCSTGISRKTTSIVFTLETDS